MGIEDSIGHAAVKLADDIKANCIVSLERVHDEENSEENTFYINIKVTLFKKSRPGAYNKWEYNTRIKKPEFGSIAPIKKLLMGAINKKYITKGERIICTHGESLGTGFKGLIFIFDVDKIFFDISTHKLAENINSDIIETIIDIALDISKEGREGKKIGTAFIIGNKDILQYTKQLIMNPFLGYSEDSRKIVDPRIRETLKEFAQLDGVFVIEDNGTVLSAGTYLDIDTTKLDIPSGLGTRHRCCAALTQHTDAIAILVSETGGRVRVFKKGKIVMNL